MQFGIHRNQRHKSSSFAHHLFIQHANR